MATGGEIWVYRSIFHQRIPCTQGVQQKAKTHTLDKLPVRLRATLHSHLQKIELAVSLIHADMTWANRSEPTQTW